MDRDPKLYSLYAVVVHIDFNRSTDYGEQAQRTRAACSVQLGGQAV